MIDKKKDNIGIINYILTVHICSFIMAILICVFAFLWEEYWGLVVTPIIMSIFYIFSYIKR